MNREKKRFENSLDDSVAKGLNTATEVLMAQIEHLLYIHSGVREYYPIEGQEMDLGPTKGCKEVVRCLEVHCRLVKGSAAREVLEVFYIEVGTRLHGYVSIYNHGTPTDFYLIQSYSKAFEAANHLPTGRIPSDRGLERVSLIHFISQDWWLPEWPTTRTRFCFFQNAWSRIYCGGRERPGYHCQRYSQVRR